MATITDDTQGKVSYERAGELDHATVIGYDVTSDGKPANRPLQQPRAEPVGVVAGRQRMLEGAADDDRDERLADLVEHDQRRLGDDPPPLPATAPRSTPGSSGAVHAPACWGARISSSCVLPGRAR